MPKPIENKEGGISICVEEERLQQKASLTKTQMNHVSHNQPNEIFSLVSTRVSGHYQTFYVRFESNTF